MDSRSEAQAEIIQRLLEGDAAKHGMTAEEYCRQLEREGRAKEYAETTGRLLDAGFGSR